MKISGIYKIQSISKPERVYVGSSKDIQKRKDNHIRLLKKESHPNCKLQGHYNKYGESDLICLVIETVLPEFLFIREQYYINMLKPSFNICKKAGGGPIKKGKENGMYGRHRYGKDNPNYGNTYTVESKNKISEKAKGRQISEETRLKFRIRMTGEGNPNYGKKHSKETLEKISKALKGRIISDEWRKNISLSQIGNHRGLGRKATKEAKENMSKSQKGRKHSQETREKISKANKGRVFSENHCKNISKSKKGKPAYKATENTRNKISEAKKIYWANKKLLQLNMN